MATTFSEIELVVVIFYVENLQMVFYLCYVYDIKYKNKGDSGTMNKTELVAAMAAKGELTQKDAAKALDAFTATVAEALKNGDKIQLIGFGTFEAVEKPAKEGINPLTKEKITIPARKAPKLKFGKALKDALN